MTKQRVGRPSRDYEVTRLNLEVRKDVRDRVEEIKEQTNAGSMASVVERALAVYDYLHEINQAGGRVVVHKGDGETHKLKIVPE